MKYILILLIILIIIIIIIYYNKTYDYFDNSILTDEKSLNKIREMLKYLDKLFEKHKITYWMDGGTLLGAIRHKNVIPWDDDADLCIFEKDEEKLLNLRNELQKSNYDIVSFWGGYKIFPLDGKIINEFEYDYKYPFTDIFIVSNDPDDDDIYQYHNETVQTTWPKAYHKSKDLMPFKKYEFHDFKLTGPNNYKPYLDRLYGNNWMEIAYKQYDHSKEEYIKNDLFDITEYKPKLWVYWEGKMPAYIKLCLDTVKKHCSKSFDIAFLNNNNIYDYLPELKKSKIDLSKLSIAHKVDYYRILLLKKYGGLYIDADTIVMKDPIEIIKKLEQYDFVGFGCTAEKCNYGYGYPSNGIMASVKNGKLITNILKNIENKLSDVKNKNKKWGYFDLGKYIVWDEIKKLEKNDNYKYYHYDNDHDGTRDADGKWINTPILFSNQFINYKNPDKQLFIVMYNSGMDNYKNMTEKELLTFDMNISKFFKKSLGLK